MRPHEHEEDEHDHGEFDPHVWMDPTLVAAWADEIAVVTPRRIHRHQRNS